MLKDRKKDQETQPRFVGRLTKCSAAADLWYMEVQKWEL